MTAKVREMDDREHVLIFKQRSLTRAQHTFPLDFFELSVSEVRESPRANTLVHELFYG